MHKNGYQYNIISTRKPEILNDRQTDELELHINNILTKYGITYLFANANATTITPIQNIFEPDYKILEGHNRHEAILRAMDSLIARNIGILSLEEIKEIARKWNQNHCIPPLDNIEFETQWKQAVDIYPKAIREFILHFRDKISTMPQ